MRRRAGPLAENPVARAEISIKKNKQTNQNDCFAVVDYVLTCSLADKLLKFLESFLGSTSPALYISSSISLIR